MKLLVGLGNPGPKYAKTRHNAGFMAVDLIAQSLNAAFDRDMCSSLIARGTAGNEDIVLAKPQTYMNLSGGAVAALMRKFSLRPEDITVIHDDIDIPPGKVKEKTGGGSGGHNGVSSIAERLGTPEFRRIRIGVGRPSAGMDAAEYVLSPFEADEKPLIAEALQDCLRRTVQAG
ncbi:MAG: aminoacyl-tRNA hydrolase [Nitrospinae bacterium]|nr:aminoacyl-tRNA hydrolase [Nitrospinota bacterium]